MREKKWGWNILISNYIIMKKIYALYDYSEDEIIFSSADYNDISQKQDELSDIDTTEIRIFIDFYEIKNNINTYISENWSDEIEWYLKNYLNS